MASKNEIRHRIALEGDEDVKRRLQAVADVGKKSQDDIERRLNNARSVAERSFAERTRGGGSDNRRDPAGSVGGALSSLAERAGLSRLVGGGGAGGLLGQALGALTSPKGLFGVIASTLATLGIRAAKISSDSEAAARRLQALGASPDTAKRLNATASKLGLGKGDLQPGLERFLADFDHNRRRTQVLHGPGPSGELNFQPDSESFLAAQRTLFYGARAGGASKEQSKAAIDAFRGNVAEQGGLTSDVVRQLQAANPVMANVLAKALSPMASGLGGFRNSGDLANYLADQDPLSSDYVNRALAREEPSAKRDADAVRGVSDAFDDLKASASRLNQEFSAMFGKPIDKGAVGAIDAATGAVNYVAQGKGPSPADFPRGQATDPAARISSEVFATDPLTRPKGIDALRPAPADQSQQAAASSADDLSKSTDSASGAMQRLGEAIASVVRSLLGGGNSSGEPKPVQFSTGGPVRMDRGGHISGPGTATSDSIPAMLSNGEYVVKASSAKKVGRRVLDWLNRGAKGFADGGEVDDDAVTIDSSSMLAPGDHTVLYEPTSGGAYVDNFLHQPGDPILDIPEVRQAIEESKQAMEEPPSAAKHKSDFTGIFGGHVFDTPGSYAGGGAVGSIPFLGGHLARFAAGGAVGMSGFGHIALPTLGDIAPPDIGSIGAGDMPHLGTVDLRTDRGDFQAHVKRDVVDELRRAARDSANARIGRAPSWDHGR
jgi:hypothetical protein